MKTQIVSSRSKKRQQIRKIKKLQAQQKNRLTIVGKFTNIKGEDWIVANNFEGQLCAISPRFTDVFLEALENPQLGILGYFSGFMQPEVWEEQFIRGKALDAEVRSKKALDAEAPDN
jgi:hypothetical protein